MKNKRLALLLAGILTVGCLATGSENQEEMKQLLQKELQ